MKAILNYIIRPIIFLFSYLPFSVLYFFSRNLLYPLLYFVVKYRKKVVASNLEILFRRKVMQN